MVNGDQITGRDGLALDADNDGKPGGTLQADFRTLPITHIPGTSVFGYVYDSYNQDDQGNDIPVVGATISLDANPAVFAVTDENGFFELGLQDLNGDGNADGLPAPEFFVHIDGSTATNAPGGTAYATLGKPFHSVPGQRVQLEMDGGPDVDPNTPGEQFHIYLPPMAMGDIVDLSPTEDTVVGFGPAAQDQIRAMFAADPAKAQMVIDTMQVTYPAGSAQDENGTPATQATIIPVDPERLPAPLPTGLDPDVVISVQAGTTNGSSLSSGASGFDVPAPVSFPNLDGLAAGEKAAIVSFDHDRGEWVSVGTATVSSDGTRIVSDDGVGIRAPGWHIVCALFKWIFCDPRNVTSKLEFFALPTVKGIVQGPIRSANQAINRVEAMINLLDDLGDQLRELNENSLTFCEKLKSIRDALLGNGERALNELARQAAKINNDAREAKQSASSFITTARSTICGTHTIQGECINRTVEVCATIWTKLSARSARLTLRFRNLRMRF